MFSGICNVLMKKGGLGTLFDEDIFELTKASRQIHVKNASVRGRGIKTNGWISSIDLPDRIRWIFITSALKILAQILHKKDQERNTGSLYYFKF